ncbi:hypothetical protein [Streptomyces sp. NBC_01800]|nr:hypothetical protein [Streptomyces sp. NBC_01800]WSA73328.1 hypothetical protein OIE65_44670 [Streptomyces sp. NBC_01800]
MTHDPPLFIVEIRKDVVYNAAGAKADFVNIGVSVAPSASRRNAPA